MLILRVHLKHWKRKLPLQVIPRHSSIHTMEKKNGVAEYKIQKILPVSYTCSTVSALFTAKDVNTM